MATSGNTNAKIGANVKSNVRLESEEVMETHGVESSASFSITINLRASAVKCFTLKRDDAMTPRPRNTLNFYRKSSDCSFDFEKRRESRLKSFYKKIKLNRTRRE